MAKCASALGLGSNNTLLKTLEEGSERLDILLKDFLRIAKSYEMRLECFYETKRTLMGKSWVGTEAGTIVRYPPVKIIILYDEVVMEISNALTKVEDRLLTNALQQSMGMNQTH